MLMQCWWLTPIYRWIPCSSVTKATYLYSLSALKKTIIIIN